MVPGNASFASKPDHGFPVDTELLPDRPTGSTSDIRSDQFDLFVGGQAALDVVELRFGNPLTRDDRVGKQGGDGSFA